MLPALPPSPFSQYQSVVLCGLLDVWYCQVQKQSHCTTMAVWQRRNTLILLVLAVASLQEQIAAELVAYGRGKVCRGGQAAGHSTHPCNRLQRLQLQALHATRRSLPCQPEALFNFDTAWCLCTYVSAAVPAG